MRHRDLLMFERQHALLGGRYIEERVEHRADAVGFFDTFGERLSRFCGIRRAGECTLCARPQSSERRANVVRHAVEDFAHAPQQRTVAIKQRVELRDELAHLVVAFRRRHAGGQITGGHDASRRVGYDAHRADPLANLAVTEAGFGEVARLLGELSVRLGLSGVALTFEGGYDLDAVRASGAATVRGILDGRRGTADRA